MCFGRSSFIGNLHTHLKNNDSDGNETSLNASLSTSDKKIQVIAQNLMWKVMYSSKRCINIVSNLDLLLSLLNNFSKYSKTESFDAIKVEHYQKVLDEKIYMYIFRTFYK